MHSGKKTKLIKLSLLVPNLTLLVNPDDSWGGFMWSSHKDGLCANSIHVDTNSRLQVVQVNVAILCDQIYYAVFTPDLRTLTREKKMVTQSSACYFNNSNTAIWSFLTCMATGKSVCASGGKNTSTAFLTNGWFPAAGWPTSMMCNCQQRQAKLGFCVTPALCPHWPQRQLTHNCVLFSPPPRSLLVYDSTFISIDRK